MEYFRFKKGVESFQVVDGPFENKKFFRGDLYLEKEIPPEEKHKFEKIPVGQAFQPANNQQAGKPAPQEKAKKVEKPEVKS